VAGDSISSQIFRCLGEVAVTIAPRPQRRSGCAGRLPVVVERLEERRLLAAIDLTAEEQLVLELVNRARANPQAEADRYGIGLNDGLAAGTITSDPKQPLTPNQALENAATAHTLDMLARDFFSHTNPDGRTASQRATDAGYNWNLVGENIAYQSSGSTNREPVVLSHHQGLFESPGHRRNILNSNYRELGAGERWGNYTGFNVSMLTELFGNRSGNSFVTGVAYTDLILTDTFYTIGEAVTGATVTATRSGSGESYVTTTGTSGGYSLQVPDGTYTVTLSGGSLALPISKPNAVVSAANVKVDFVTLNQRPTIVLTPNARTFAEGGAPVVLDSGAIVIDPDSANFDTSTLTVTVSVGANVNDRLEVRHQGTAAWQIGIAGSNVSFGGTTIGSFSGGGGSSPLSITLGANAATAAVQALLRNVTFRTSGAPINSASRTIDIVVTDGNGGASTSVRRTVNVVGISATANTTRMFRAYNPNADYHFFTISTGEFSNAVAASCHDETAGRSGFAVLDNLLANSTPIHRLYNPNNGRHYYTINDGERDFLVSIGWRFEKEEGFMYAASAPGATAIHRLYNDNSGVHLYTESAATRTAILTTFAGIWVEHAALGHAFTVNVAAERSRLSAIRAATASLLRDEVPSTELRASPPRPRTESGTVVVATEAWREVVAMERPAGREVDVAAEPSRGRRSLTGSSRRGTASPSTVDGFFALEWQSDGNGLAAEFD